MFLSESGYYIKQNLKSINIFINENIIHQVMVKCSICNQKIQTTFLNKIVGTIVKKEGKPKHVCSDCQKEHSGKDLHELM